MKIILASKSPTRKALFEKLNIPFETTDSEFDEQPIKNTVKDARELVMKLAEATAKKSQNSIIIASDTVVLHENKILGKPKDETQALQMMMDLSGQEHHIISGSCLINTQTKEKKLKLIDNIIIFKKYSEEEAKEFLSKTTPLKYAGAYKLSEALNAGFVDFFDGDEFSTAGLDVSEIKKFTN